MILQRFLEILLNILRSMKQPTNVHAKRQRRKEINVGKNMKKLNQVNKTKQVVLKRQYEESCTLGTMYLDGEEVCKTLERPWVDNKENISCIPEGKYECIRDNTGKFRYWKVLNVPNRSLIEIHNGNFQDETRGCILVGRVHEYSNEEWIVKFSLPTLRDLKDVLGDKFELIIKENEGISKKAR